MSQPVCPWSAHAPPSGQSSSPFLRNAHSLSTTATAAGELFLFGGFVYSSNSTSNDLYVFSTRNFSTTFLRTSGDIPSPRYAHSAVFTSTILLIWGGTTGYSHQNAQYRSDDDSFYLLNLVSREWTRIAVHGPGPGGRYYHTMTLVGSKLFVFGGRSAAKGHLNDIWALDLNRLESNPFWESYEPATGNEKPPLRAAHVSVTTGDRIIIFGGCDAQNLFDDTWSFNISTRKWTELQCTGSIPSPRAEHAAVLVDDVMYVFGGRHGARYNTALSDLTVLNLSTQRWAAFRDIGPSPHRRCKHAIASDGTRVFVLGGKLSPGAQEDEAKPIHVLDTEHLDFPEPDSQQITREQNPSLDSLPTRSTGASGRPRRVPEEDDDGESSTQHRARLVTPNAPSGRETARLEDGRLIELERQLSETLVVKTERDRHIAELTDELELMSALFKQAEANGADAAAAAAEAKKNAELEIRELQAKLDESLLSRDQALEQAQSALQKVSCTAEAYERELTEMRSELEASKSESAAFRLRLADTENSCSESKSKAEADTYRTLAATGLVNTDEDRVMQRLVGRMQAMEAEIASLRGNEKSFERMECSNEG